MPKGLLVEVFSIVFSVLLALAVDRWRENRRRIHLAKELTRGILEELQTNLKEIKKLLPLHEDVLRHLSNLPLDSNVTPMMMSIELPGILSSMWELSKTTQALNYIPLPLVTQLSKIYIVQGFLQHMEEKVLDILMIQPDVMASSTKRLLENLLAVEKQLVSAYEILIPSLKAFVEDKSPVTQ